MYKLNVFFSFTQNIKASLLSRSIDKTHKIAAHSILQRILHAQPPTILEYSI